MATPKPVSPKPFATREEKVSWFREPKTIAIVTWSPTFFGACYVLLWTLLWMRGPYRVGYRDMPRYQLGKALSVPDAYPWLFNSIWMLWLLSVILASWATYDLLLRRQYWAKARFSINIAAFAVLTAWLVFYYAVLRGRFIPTYDIM